MTTCYVMFSGLAALLLAVAIGCSASSSSLPGRATRIESQIQPAPTACAAGGPCSPPIRGNIDTSPLGALIPAPGLLPSGTISVTLALTTAAPADCRWSAVPGSSYGAMQNAFMEGQGTTTHSTAVTGLHDLDDRRFYVRCQDLSGGRDPDNVESQTHLRVLGPWNGGYPRIALLWISSPALGARFFAGYDLLIPYRWDGQSGLLAAIRAINPAIKILHYQYGTKGRPEQDPLTAEWWNSKPGEPGYPCLLRDSHGQILLVSHFGHPMYNMTQPYCRTVAAQRNVALFLSSAPDEGDSLAYDGIYWDLLHQDISWLGNDIDGDVDGRPDDPAALGAAYEAGVTDFLAQVHTALPNVVLSGNEAPLDYASWLNGRLFEWQLRDILDGGVGNLTWEPVMADITDWTGRGRTPRVTFVQTAPEPFYAEKNSFQHVDEMPPAMMAEAAASYQRMRYGLVSALLAGALFSYDYGAEEHGQPWWYDEFGAHSGASTLPGHGYLGQPTGEPALLKDSLDTPDRIRNGTFDGGLANWEWWVDGAAGASARVDIDAAGGISGTSAPRIIVTQSAEPSSVLFLQSGLSTVANQDYTVSFWARSDVTRTLGVRLEKTGPPGTFYGFRAQAVVTPVWQHFHLTRKATTSAEDGQLQFQVGAQQGSLWLDDVQFQGGALGVWARSFERGLAVLNTTQVAQTVQLPATYCKLDGQQAPLFQARVDDEQASASGGWSEQAANGSQFGRWVHTASAAVQTTMIYTPTLAYSGAYQVLAWVAPAATQSSAVSVTIQHVQGQVTVPLDETAGEIGWHSLGIYPFDAGSTGSATLSAAGQGTVVADAFKWVSVARYNDGSEVSQLTLQPQDGIVLLNSCNRPVKHYFYLPMIIRQ